MKFINLIRSTGKSDESKEYLTNSSQFIPDDNKYNRNSSKNESVKSPITYDINKLREYSDKQWWLLLNSHIADSEFIELVRTRIYF